MEHNGPHPASHPPTQYYDHSVWVAMVRVRTSQTKYAVRNFEKMCLIKLYFEKMCLIKL